MLLVSAARKHQQKNQQDKSTMVLLDGVDGRASKTVNLTSFSRGNLGVDAVLG
jgi:hypothetical protein